MKEGERKVILNMPRVAVCQKANVYARVCPADSMKEDARKMVLTMVDMERSYLTADVFRDIISQNGAVDGADQPGMLRTLSGLP